MRTPGRRRAAVAAGGLAAVLLAGCTAPTIVPSEPAPVPSGGSVAPGGVASTEPSSAPDAPAAASASPVPTAEATVVAPGAFAVPSTGGVRYAPTASGSLDGRVIVLDPGHNGKYKPSVNHKYVPMWGSTKKQCLSHVGGTASDNKTTEAMIVFAIAERTRDALRAQGATVVLTRPDNNGIGPCNSERAEIANLNAASALIALHTDGAPDEVKDKTRGFHLNYSERMMGGPAMTQRSILLAQQLDKELLARTGIPRSTYLQGQSVKARNTDLPMLNGVATGPAVLAELGILQNPTDFAVLSTPEGQDKIAGAIVAAVQATMADPSVATMSPLPTTSVTPAPSTTP